MEKTEFLYTKWVLRHLSAWAIAISAKIVLDYLNSKFLGIQLNGILEFVVVFLLMWALLSACYFVINYYKLFQRKGCYWVSDGVVYIQTKKDTYSLSNIEYVTVGTSSPPFDSYYGHIFIELENIGLNFYSFSHNPLESFFDCDIAPLLDTILAHNPQLIKHENLDWWEAKSNAKI